MKAAYIVVEGGDGAGKDTQIELLRKDFPQLVYTREPGGTSLGKTLRGMVLHETHGSLPLLTEAFLFLADRAQHASEVIAPALKAGKGVVSNRSWMSMMAYHIYGREQMELKPLVEAAFAQIYKECPLSLAIVLDVPAQTGMQRQKEAGKELDTMERLAGDFHDRVRQGFLEAAKALPQAKVIDASRPIEAVYADVKAAVESVLL